jgi:UDP-N-acetylglucosamine 2-epimerase (non-hydrolysing)
MTNTFHARGGFSEDSKPRLHLGGLVLGVPCLTLRENTERPATVEQGTNEIVGVDPDRILAAARSVLTNPKRHPRRPPLWDGKTAQRILEILRAHLLCA